MLGTWMDSQVLHPGNEWNVITRFSTATDPNKNEGGGA